MRRTWTAPVNRYPRRYNSRSIPCASTLNIRRRTSPTNRRKKKLTRKSSRRNSHTIAKRKQDTRGRENLERQREVGIQFLQLSTKCSLDARECRLTIGIESQHEDRCRVRRAHQAPAIRPIRTHAVDRRDARAVEDCLLLKFLYEFVVFAFGE